MHGRPTLLTVTLLGFVTVVGFVTFLGNFVTGFVTLAGGFVTATASLNRLNQSSRSPIKISPKKGAPFRIEGGPVPEQDLLGHFPSGLRAELELAIISPSQINGLARSPTIPLIPLALPNCAKNVYLLHSCLQ
jgi:hypothetical protein